MFIFKYSEQVAAIADICPLRVPLVPSRRLQILFKWDQVWTFIPKSDRRDAVQNYMDFLSDGEAVSVPDLRDHLIKLSIWLEGYETADTE